MKRQMLSGVTAILVAGASTITAQPRGEGSMPFRKGGEARGHHARREGRIEMLIGRLAQNPELKEKLGIEDTQIETLRNASFELRAKQVDLHARMQKAALEQARLLTQPDVDEAALMEATEKIGRARTELAKLRIRQLLLVKQTLTAEQINGIRRRLRQSGRRRMRREEDDRDAWRERRRYDRDRERAPVEEEDDR